MVSREARRREALVRIGRRESPPRRDPHLLALGLILVALVLAVLLVAAARA